MLQRREKLFESLLWNSRLVVLVAEGSEFAQRVLLIRSLDDLKDRLAKLVLLILVVKFFEHALTLKYGGPLELLYLAAGVLLVSLALHFSQGKSRA